MSQLLGFALAVLIGLSLGMLGGGGSILTVPVFVFVMGFAPKDAIAMSLPVVGTTSLVGALGHWRHGNVDVRAFMTFAPLAMLGAVVGAKLATRVSGTFQLALLGVVMLAAGVLMLRGGGAADESAPIRTGGAQRSVVLAASGLGVGVLTGLVGVGGGFLIVPGLVLLAGVPMKRAVGTSLLVISLSTLTALVVYRGEAELSWRVVALFTLLAIVGTVGGTRLARHVPARRLRVAFGILVLVVASLLLYRTQTAGAQQTAPRLFGSYERPPSTLCPSLHANRVVRAHLEPRPPYGSRPGLSTEAERGEALLRRRDDRRYVIVRLGPQRERAPVARKRLLLTAESLQRRTASHEGGRHECQVVDGRLAEGRETAGCFVVTSG